MNAARVYERVLAKAHKQLSDPVRVHIWELVSTLVREQVRESVRDSVYVRAREHLGVRA